MMVMKVTNIYKHEKTILVLNVVTRHCDKVLNKVGDDPSKPKILLLAPTGMAACIIGKCTMQRK